jgi:ribosomal biogenesis protein LAS1
MSMFIRDPQQTPFKFPVELEELYKGFYLIKNAEKKRECVSKVRAYLSKGAIPHSIEMTALLTEAVLEDERKMGVNVFNYEETYPKMIPTNLESDLTVRLNYSMCIIKFVNGLLDPFQQSLYNISLHRLAIELRLPNYFVESRHVGTHERLPSLEMMRLICQRALNWLKFEYWESALNQYKSQKLLSVTQADWESCIRNSRRLLEARERQLEQQRNPHKCTRDDLKYIEETLRSIRKFRKLEIQEKRSVKEGMVEVKNLKAFIARKSIDQIISTMIFRNYLIIHGEKSLNVNEKQINGLRMIWKSLLEALVDEKSFTYYLWKELFTLATQKTLVEYTNAYIDEHIINNERILYLQNESEIMQVCEWTLWILENTKIVNSDNIGEITDLLLTKSEISRRCLPILKEKHSSFIKEAGLDGKVEKLDSIMNRFWVLEYGFNKRKLAEIDAEDGGDRADSTTMKKKNGKDTFFFFDTYDSWRPVPFGCPPS